MKKRISAFLLAVLMLVTTFAASVGDLTRVKADDLVLKLHLHRDDGDYKSWDVWLWEVDGGDGAAYTFDEVDENGDGVATKVITPGTNSVGFIVRTAGSWDKKDIDADQFIDLSTVTSGTVHFYVVSGVEGGTMELGTDAVAGVKLSSVKYNQSKGVIDIKATSEIENADKAFSVKCNGVDAAIESVTANGKTYSIKLKDEVDLTASYSVTFDGTDYSVIIPSIFSTDEFEQKYTYTGNDLGATWSKDSTTFRVWAPTAAKVKVNLYESGDKKANDLKQSIDMTADVNGTWVAKVDGDLNKTYYTYSVTIGDKESEACDPYARATGINGDRAMVIDLASTNPEGWDNDKNPNADLKITDAIIYELQIRDLGADASSNISKPGTYLSLTEHGTKTASGISTGVDHIKELGITHLQILPFYDFGSVDESKGGYNWGYDPKNYNVPEGSYSTDPANGEVRVSEVKQMVQSLHNDGISVVMDVVYNHVYQMNDFCFNVIVPQYFSRIDDNGKASSGSGCGNDTASERSMVRKYIVDSVLYWATEYHIDGFRFDLVGLIDTDTINEVVKEVHAVRPDIIFYGEGWTMNTATTKENVTLTTQVNSSQVQDFAFFNDNIRDDIKGSVFSASDKGYVTGKTGLNSSITRSWLGRPGTWCKSPSQTVNYASCHDNNTLFDRICNVKITEDLATKIKRNNLAAALYLTAEGIPFMQAGEEMLRSKVNAEGRFEDNTYNLGDGINSLKWDTLDDAAYMGVFEYYKGLIAFRKAHAGLRLSTAAEVAQYVKEMEGIDKELLGFEVSGDATGEESDGIIVVFNPTEQDVEVTLPEGKWGVCVNGERAGADAVEVVEGKAVASSLSALVLVKNMKAGSADASASSDGKILGMTKPVFFGVVAAVAVVVIVVIVVVVVAAKKKKNK